MLWQRTVYRNVFFSFFDIVGFTSKPSFFSDHDDKTVDEKVDLLLQGRKVYNHFCVDTNVFLHDLWFVEYLVDRPRSWVYIPYYVLNELDHQTKGRTPEHTDEVKKAARRATKQIDEWLKERKVMSESVDKSIANLARGFNNDDKILRSCLSKGPGAFLISNDRNLQARVTYLFLLM